MFIAMNSDGSQHVCSHFKKTSHFPRKHSGTQVAKKLGGWEWGGAGVALALNPLVYWEWCRMAMFVGLWTDRTIVKHMLESPKNNSWAGLVKFVISTSLANYRVNQLVWHIPVKTCIQFLIWIVVNVVHFHWIDDAELFASSMTDGHCNWNNRGWLTLHICSIHYLKCLFMYSLYFITLQRSGKGPVTKPLCSIRPEHRGTFHTLFFDSAISFRLGTLAIFV